MLSVSHELHFKLQIDTYKIPIKIKQVNAIIHFKEIDFGLAKK
jgi:hypothetical protein